MMRLLNSSTLEIEEFVQGSIPEYVILSHTWDSEEVTFQDFQSGAATTKKGYKKVEACCNKAAEDGFSYCWVDTCCIDKTSSSELSEALNSMYQWYKNAKICYAYLADFEDLSGSVIESYRSFSKCRWWTRGWTLQELLAPKIVEFYNHDWEELGTKLSLQEQITEITGIDEGVLRGTDPLHRTVAVRMSWAARRKTTRIEDQAYCLMGIFGVNMPLLYGEGNRAFIRLQEEIMRVTEDFTLFTWSPVPYPGLSDPNISKGLLATSPSYFVDSSLGAQVSTKHAPQHQPWGYRDLLKHCTSVFTLPSSYAPPSLTSRGLHITLPIRSHVYREHYACITTLRLLNTKEEVLLCVVLQRLNPSEQYVRRTGPDLVLLQRSMSKDFKFRSIYMVQPPAEPELLAHPWQSDKTPSLLLVKPKLGSGHRLNCVFSSWISIASVLRARFVSHESLADSQSTLVATPPTFSSSKEITKTNHRHRINTLINAFINLNYETTLSIAMNNPPHLSFFSDVDTPHKKGPPALCAVLGFEFEHEGSLSAAFLVEVALFEDKPLCDAIFINRDDLSDEDKRREWCEQVQSAALRRDRVTLPLRMKSSEAGDRNEGGKKVELDISIRPIGSARVASSSAMSVTRYTLSIKEREGKSSVSQSDAVGPLPQLLCSE